MSEFVLALVVTQRLLHVKRLEPQLLLWTKRPHWLDSCKSQESKSYYSAEQLFCVEPLNTLITPKKKEKEKKHFNMYTVVYSENQNNQICNDQMFLPLCIWFERHVICAHLPQSSLKQVNEIIRLRFGVL